MSPHLFSGTFDKIHCHNVATKLPPPLSMLCVCTIPATYLFPPHRRSSFGMSGQIAPANRCRGAAKILPLNSQPLLSAPLFGSTPGEAPLGRVVLPHRAAAADFLTTPEAKEKRSDPNFRGKYTHTYSTSFTHSYLGTLRHCVEGELGQVECLEHGGQIARFRPGNSPR